MKQRFLNLETVVGVAAGLTLTYLASIILELRLVLILGLYLSATGATLWMVFRILKDPWSTDKSFDDYFYQDRPDIRRQGTE